MAGVETGAAVVTTGWAAGVVGAAVAADVACCGELPVHPAKNAVSSNSPHTIPIRIIWRVLIDVFMVTRSIA